MLRPRILVALLTLGGIGSPVAAGDLGIRHFRTYASPADGVTRPFTVRTPKGYTGAVRLPAVLFLHGRGGWAGSFQQQPYHDAADAGSYVLIFWQGRPDPNGLMSSYYVDAANGIPDETDVLSCLDASLAEFAIDPARVHLVGFSQGAKGALLVGLKNPDRFASVTSGAAPTDAFQGQLWSPTFPDYRDAAAGPAAGASGAVLARWFAQSPRFYLAAARNLPLSLWHGQLDTVVPDSPALFPYRNTHHVADTPGFTDERGATPTLAELRAADPGGYVFEARYPAGIGHDELGLLDAPSIFAFFAGKSVARDPERVSGVTYEERSRGHYWVTLARASPPDGRPSRFSARRDVAANLLEIEGAEGGGESPPALTVDPARAGLDASRRLELRLTGALALRVSGVSGTPLVTRDGVPLREGLDFTREAAGLAFPLASYGAGARLVLETSPAPVLESDLLVPALVESAGANGARFSSELTLANLGDEPATLELLLLDRSGRETTVTLAPRRTALLTSAALFGLLGASGGAAPLRLRPRGAAATVAGVRVFNTGPDDGTYGLSFPVRPAGESVVRAGGEALLFGASGTRPERVNVSLFAPFGASSGSLVVVGPSGAALATIPFSLAPLERVQLNDVLAGSMSGTTARVLVAAGGVQAYATVVSSSATNDPFRTPALSSTAAAASWSVPAVAAATGRNAAFFSSDLYLSAGEATDVRLTFRPHDGAPLERSLSLAAGETRLVPDVVRTLFPSRVPDYGALGITSTSPLLAFAVTRSDSAGGASSQDLPCVPAGGEVTAASPAIFVGLAESSLARSNLTLWNAGGGTSVALSLLAEDGPRGEVTVTLGAGEFRQLDSVAAHFAGAPTSAAVLTVTPAEGGSVVAAVARIDNVTNDPTGLPPLRPAR